MQWRIFQLKHFRIRSSVGLQTRHPCLSQHTHPRESLPWNSKLHLHRKRLCECPALLLDHNPSPTGCSDLATLLSCTIISYSRIQGLPQISRGEGKKVHFQKYLAFSGSLLPQSFSKQNSKADPATNPLP